MSGHHAYIADLLSETRIFVRRFVVVGERELDAVALWNAHTYVYDCAQATPYLHPHSPEPGSGKTTLLDVLELTAANAIQADNLTEASLFRMIAKLHPTLLFDEIDAVFGRKHSDSAEGIRQVLNSGYRKHKRVWRCVPPSHNVEPFDVFCPKATAGLHELPGTLAQRSIPIEMQPPLPTDLYEELDREEVSGEAEILQQNLQSWADESGDLLREPALKPARLAGLDARGNEIWRILLRIANQAGGEWPERARAAALELSGRDRRQQDASIPVQLLGHIRDLFEDERMSCSAVAELLNADDQLPYGGWSDGKGLSSRELGKKLAAFKIRAKPIRIDGKRAGNGYEREQFEDAWSRYLPDPALETGTTGTTGSESQKAPEIQPVQDPSVPVMEKAANPHEQRVVPVSKTEYGNGGQNSPLEREAREQLKREIDRRTRARLDAPPDSEQLEANQRLWAEADGETCDIDPDEAERLHKLYLEHVAEEPSA
jgi:hypothetical protein